MAVRNTESKLPLAVANNPNSGEINVDNLGQAIRDNNYALVSYLSSPLIQDSRNDYVVFVLNGAAADQYHWSVKDSDNNEVASGTTDAGIFDWTPGDTGEYDITVEIKSGGAVVKTLNLHQTVLSLNPGEGLDQLFPFELGASVSGFWPLTFITNLIKRAVYAGEWDSTREVLFELWGYILEGATSTGVQGIPAQLLAALTYQQVLTHPKEFSITRPIYVGPAVRSTELAWAAEDLNQPNSFHLSTQIDNALGVCQLRPETVAMLLGYTQWREKPEEPKDRKAIDDQIHADFVALPANTKIEIFNLLRFPKTNIALAAKLLAKLKNRTDPVRFAQLTQQDLMPQTAAVNPPPPNHDDAILLIVTEYYIGAVKTPTNKAVPDSEAKSVLKSMKDTYIKPFFRKHSAVDPLYGGYSLTRGFPNDNPAVQPDSDANLRYGSVNNRPVPGGTHYIADLRADLQALGFRIHCEQAPANAAVFDLKLQWAVREFQIYSKMNFIAMDRDQLPANPNMTNRLRKYPNLFRYAGPVSGVVNGETRRRIRAWKAMGWRCPVIISPWTVLQNGQRTALFQANDNIWNSDVVTVGGANGPTFFAQDYTGYYSNIPQSRIDGGDPAIGDGFMVVGKYTPWSIKDQNNQPIPYKIFGGPVCNPPRRTAQNPLPGQTWPEAELLPENLSGRNLYLQQPDPGGADLLAQRSTYKVVRAMCEQECEGFFDVINAYDNAFVSQGPCHWTLGVVFRHQAPTPTQVDRGELCAFLSYLKHIDPAAYTKAVRFFGADITLAWGNDGAALSVPGRKYTAWVAAQREDRSFAALPLLEEEGNLYKTWHWIYRFIMAGRTIPGYQRRMWTMARIRLRDIGNTSWPGANGPFIPVQGGGQRPALIKEVYTSERAMSLLLRWHVRSPGDVVSPGLQVDNAGNHIHLARAFDLSNLPRDVSTWPADPEPALIQGLMQVLAPGNNDPDNYKRVHNWPWWETRDNIRGYALQPGNIDPWSEAWTDTNHHARVRRLKTARNSFLFWNLQPDEI